MNNEQNARILKDLLEYLKEQHSNLPTHVFEVLGEVIDDLKKQKFMNNEKTTIHAEVLLSSGTTSQSKDYKIEDVISWSSYGSGYYEIKTKTGIYCFPISRTVLKIIKN